MIYFPINVTMKRLSLLSVVLSFGSVLAHPYTPCDEGFE